MVGARITSARTEAGLTVEDLAHRTKIRASILMAMEDDDFSACGGDVYARGHLKGIASALGIDPAELLDLFDASLGGT